MHAFIFRAINYLSKSFLACKCKNLPVESLDHLIVEVEDGGGELDDRGVVTPLEVTCGQVVEAAQPQPLGLSLHLRGLSLGLNHLGHIMMDIILLWS